MKKNTRKPKQTKQKYLVMFASQDSPLNWKYHYRYGGHDTHKPNNPEIGVGYLDGLHMGAFQMVVEATSHADAREKANRRIQQHTYTFFRKYGKKAKHATVRACASRVFLMDETFHRRGEYWWSHKMSGTYIPDLYSGDLRG